MLLLCPVAALTQSTGSLSGRVLDPSGAAIPSAVITVSNPVGGFTKRTQAALDGSYSFSNLPLQSYDVTAEHAGFQRVRRMVALRSNVPAVQDLTLALASDRTTVDVQATGSLLIEPADTGTRAQINQADIERLSLQVGNRGLEAALLTFPGFSQNANGAIHPRGAHNQMTFVVDGMPISDQLTGAFANAVDPNVVQTVELFTGNIPAEYGNKVSAVANVTTRAGLGSGRVLGGTLLLSAAEFDTVNSLAQVSGEKGKFGYSASLSAMKSNRYLDQVSLDNLHNGGNLERGFARADYQPNGRDVFRTHFMAGRSAFQLANLRSQHANGMAQRQGLQDASLMLAWVRTLNPSSTLDVTASLRTAEATLTPSEGDTPVTAEQRRRLSTFTLWNRFNSIRGAHTLKGGVDYQYFPVQEQFGFAITAGGFNPPESEEYLETLLPHDLTRGGRPFQFARRAAGALYTGFVQDNVRWGRWQMALGLRYDNYRFLANGNQLQPRIGVSYHLRETDTVLRASYNRTYQTPPNENLLLSGSVEASRLASPVVRAALGGSVATIRPERQNFYELGVQQALAGRFSLNASFYHKNARDQQDNDNFFNTGIIFPMTLARIRVNGVEGRAVFPEWRGLRATVSMTHARAISTPPFTGGLFLGSSAVDALSAGPFVIDHDQKLSVQNVTQYTSRKGYFVTVTTRYDSGLVTNPSDPEEVAADADYADLLPYVNLRATPPRTRPRTIVDAAAGYEHKRNDRKLWELTVQTSNLTNRTALYNFQSLFAGTRLVQPRTVGVRMRWFF
ncbi:MAG: TonB-dependent receptor [Bryobacterales bacterium]|nr:TonB-dependent receptor [Bryobacterales bacterium]